MNESLVPPEEQPLVWDRATDIAEVRSTWQARTVILRLSTAMPLILEGSGADLWHLTETCSDLEQMLSDLADAYPGLPLEEARPQVEYFVRSLLAEGFLQHRDVLNRTSTAAGD